MKNIRNSIFCRNLVCYFECDIGYKNSILSCLNFSNRKVQKLKP